MLHLCFIISFCTYLASSNLQIHKLTTVHYIYIPAPFKGCQWNLIWHPLEGLGYHTLWIWIWHIFPLFPSKNSLPRYRFCFVQGSVVEQAGEGLFRCFVLLLEFIWNLLIQKICYVTTHSVGASDGARERERTTDPTWCVCWVYCLHCKNTFLVDVFFDRNISTKNTQMLWVQRSFGCAPIPKQGRGGSNAETRGVAGSNKGSRGLWDRQKGDCYWVGQRHKM